MVEYNWIIATIKSHKLPFTEITTDFIRTYMPRCFELLDKHLDDTWTESPEACAENVNILLNGGIEHARWYYRPVQESYEGRPLTRRIATAKLRAALHLARHSVWEKE